LKCPKEYQKFLNMKTVALVLFPQFQMLAYVLATETLRVANKCAGHKVFGWHTLCATNAGTVASNGAVIEPDITDWSFHKAPDLVLLCAGYDPLDQVTARVRSYLARAGRAGATLGGVDTGTIVLAHLGLLDGYRSVLHHEAEAGFREKWPDIAVSDQIYCLDGPRLTAAGGTATGDAMLSWIAQVEGPDLATRVSDGMAHGAIRSAQERQRPIPTADPVLIAMNDLIITYMEDPLPISSLCEELGVSMKQLRRRCALTFAKTPSAHYLGLRLEHGFSLIKNTHLSISEIAVATGFASVSAFSRAFRGQFSISPSQLRKTRDSNLSDGA
jgi:AraC family carnitine catabolism transcriptional activator